MLLLSIDKKTDDDNIRQRKIDKQKRKQELKKKIRIPRKKKSWTRTKYKATQDGTNRTFYEEIFETYCKLLGLNFHISTTFCFSCNNFFPFTDAVNILPKKCKVCDSYFYSPSMKKIPVKDHDQLAFFSRPDFILDCNTMEMRKQYISDVAKKRYENIKKYHEKYMENIGIIRIDGNIHDKQSQKIKDYKQLLNFKEAEIKLFIVRNSEIDNFLENNDNGRSLLERIRFIVDCILDQRLYDNVYSKEGDFIELTSKPF